MLVSFERRTLFYVVVGGGVLLGQEVFLCCEVIWPSL